MRRLPAIASESQAYPAASPEAGAHRAAERWGWQLRAPPVSVPPPFTAEPPGLPDVDLDWLARLAGRHDRAVRSRRGHLLRATALAGLAGMGWALAVWLGNPVGWVAASLSVAAAGFAGLAGRPWVLAWRAAARYRRWRQGVLARLAEHAGRCRHWVRQRAEHERRHQPAAPRWEPVRPTTTERIDVYGGGPDGWTALLSTAITSMTTAGVEVTVVDLSQDGVGGRIAAGIPGVRVRLPDQLAGLRLLAGVSATDLAAILSEVVAAVDRADTDRAADADLLEQVLTCLAGSGGEPAVTFGRLHAAMRVVARLDSPPDELAPAEYRALVDLLGETGRRSAEPRLFRLSAVLRQLAAMEAASDATPAAGVEDAAEPGDRLLVWEVSDLTSDLATDLLAHLAAQVLSHRLRHEPALPAGGRCLVVVGVDRLRRATVERLDQLARRRGVRLVLCARHLREDAVDVLGGGDAVVFLRLGNAREAEQAATFIGREHQLVASQLTVSRSTSGSLTVGGSTSHTAGEQESTTEGTQESRSVDHYQLFGLLDLPYDAAGGSRGGQRSATAGTSTSLTEGTSWSEQTGYSTSESVSYQRVYEYAVTPKFLQELSPTAFVLVDPQDPDSPRLGDCGIDPLADSGSDPSNQPDGAPPVWIG